MEKKEELVYEKAKRFIHCKNCLEHFNESPLHEVMTPRDYGVYEIAEFEIPIPNITHFHYCECTRVVFKYIFIVLFK
jgi:hypothetical protein